VQIPASALRCPSELSKIVENLKADIVLSPSSSVIAIPVANGLLFDEIDEFRILIKKLAVYRAVETCGIISDDSKYLYNILSDKLQDEWRYPNMVGHYDSSQILFPNEAAVVSCQQAIDNFALERSQKTSVDSRGIVIYAIRNLDCSAAHAYREACPSKARFGQNRNGLLSVVGEDGWKRASKLLVVLDGAGQWLPIW
jgi:hypothetical protein